MAHGLDSVISPLNAKRSAQVIQEINPDFRWLPSDMDHEICQDELAALAQFLRQHPETGSNLLRKACADFRAGFAAS